jgi:hypothetical protein
MGFKKSDVKKFEWKGKDEMINLESSRTPRNIPRDFRAKLILKGGRKVPARGNWRRQIWKFWYTKRREAIILSFLRQASSQLMGWQR